MSMCLAYIADGFVDDCEELIHRCQQAVTVDFKTFCDIWKQMNFSCIFYARMSTAELAEFSEEVLQIAKRYMISDNTNLEATIAGLFLVYGLINLQPYAGFASLRLVHSDMASLRRLEADCRSKGRRDALYVLGSVLAKAEYHADARERGADVALRKYLEEYTNVHYVGYRPKGVFYRQTEELDIIRDLNGLTKKYTEAKAAIEGSATDRSLHYTKPTLAAELDTSLKHIINGILDSDSDTEASGSAPAQGNRAQEIKSRAMKLAVDGVRHLATVDDRSKPATPKTSPAKKPAKKTKSSPQNFLLRAKSDKKNMGKFGLNFANPEDVDTSGIHEGGIEVDASKIDLDLLPLLTTLDADGKSVEIEFIKSDDVIDSEFDQSTNGNANKTIKRKRAKKSKKSGNEMETGFNESTDSTEYAFNHELSVSEGTSTNLKMGQTKLDAKKTGKGMTSESKIVGAKRKKKKEVITEKKSNESDIEAVFLKKSKPGKRKALASNQTPLTSAKLNNNETVNTDRTKGINDESKKKIVKSITKSTKSENDNTKEVTSISNESDTGAVFLKKSKPKKRKALADDDIPSTSTKLNNNAPAVTDKIKGINDESKKKIVKTMSIRTETKNDNTIKLISNTKSVNQERDTVIVPTKRIKKCEDKTAETPEFKIPEIPSSPRKFKQNEGRKS